MFLRPRKQAGEQGWARPNISAVGAIGTENGTRAAFAGDASRWLDGRLKTLAGGGSGHINLDFYGAGLGLDVAALDQAIRYSLDFDVALLQGNGRSRRNRRGRSDCAISTRKSSRSCATSRCSPGSSITSTSRYRRRRPFSNSTAATMSSHRLAASNAETVYLASREELGASVEFERFQQVVMGWYPVADTVTLGLRADYQRASDSTPFFLRPYIELRGVQAMRYQGDEMASGEIEARWRCRDRWSVVFAAGAGTARSTRRDSANSQDIASGAVGFRYELARKFGLHAGMDVGFSSETTAIYLQVGNAWFRP